MKVVYGFFFIAISIYPTYAQSTQTAVRDFGGNIEITCSVMNVNFFPIAWFKFEKDDPTKTTVLSISNKLMVRNSKFSLRIHVENGTNNHILKIQNIQKTDIAIYRCVVMCDDANSDANTSADVELDVNRPPVISDASSPTLVNAMEGQFSRLECYADGFPEPRVTWTRENNGILTTGGNFYRGNVLRFYNVTKDDRGIYFCNIVNGIGGGVRRIIDFRVTFSPVITVSKIMYSHREPLKRNLDVQCLVEAYPTPKIEWLYNGVVLPNDNHDYKIMENTTAHQFAYSALTFLKIDNERIGKYTCKAQNTIGTAEVTAIEHQDLEQVKKRTHQERTRTYFGFNIYGLSPYL
ncbi:lachesin-like [Aphis gossypii]|nr:lachesin-like [Aphis gossypii]